MLRGEALRDSAAKGSYGSGAAGRLLCTLPAADSAVLQKTGLPLSARSVCYTMQDLGSEDYWNKQYAAFCLKAPTCLVQSKSQFGTMQQVLSELPCTNGCCCMEACLHAT